MWSAIEQFGTKAITLVSSIILARTLLPEDFGLLASVAILINLGQQLVDGGLSQGLIRKKEPKHEDFNAFFWSNTSLTLLISIVSIAVSPWIADFYGNENIPAIVASLFGVMCVLNLSKVCEIELIKSSRFKVLTQIRVCATIVSVIFAIVLAKSGFGYWSLVGQQLIFALLMTILFYVKTNFRPSFKIKGQAVRELFNFGIPLCIGQIYRSCANQLSSVYIGKMSGLTLLGQADRGRLIPGHVMAASSGYMTRINYPVLSSLQDDPEARARQFGEMSYRCLSVGILFLIPMSLYAHIFVEIFFGSQWKEAAAFFSLAAFFIPVQIIWILILDLLKSGSRLKSILSVSLVTSTCQIICIVSLARFGPWWAILGDLIGRMIGVLLLLRASKNCQLVSGKILINAIWRIIKITAAPIAIAILGVMLIPNELIACILLTAVCGYLILNVQGFMDFGLQWIRKNLGN